MKKLVVLLAIVVLFVGCSVLSQKETLTREQQDNVVRGIVKNYEIESIEFIKFNKDIKTGSYHLIFIINNDSKYQTGITISKKSELNEKLDYIGLNPINKFEFLKRESPLEDTDNHYKMTKIKYLED